MKFKILLKTKNYVLVHKPSGYVVYSDQQSDDAISAQKLLQRELGAPVFPVHRIDKQTCGILMYAFSSQKADQLGNLFKTKSVEKSYLALCHGQTPPKQRIDIPLKKHKQKITESAVTNIETLETVKIEIGGEQRLYSLVMAKPETGRFHQIRRHLKAIKAPIVGDPTHGNSWNNDFFLKTYKINRTLLSAISVSFADPETKKKVLVRSQPDPDFTSLLEKLGVRAKF